jgi:hypothetical protein
MWIDVLLVFIVSTIGISIPAIMGIVFLYERVSYASLVVASLLLGMSGISYLILFGATQSLFEGLSQ